MMKKNLLTTLLLLTFFNFTNLDAQNKADCSELKVKIDDAFKNSTSIRAGYSSRARGLYLDYEVDSNKNTHFVYRKTGKNYLQYAFFTVNKKMYSIKSDEDVKEGAVAKFNHEVWIDSVKNAKNIFDKTFTNCFLKEKINITGTLYAIQTIVTGSDSIDLWFNPKTNKLKRIISKQIQRDINLEWTFNDPFEVKIPIVDKKNEKAVSNFSNIPPTLLYDKDIDGAEPVYVSVDNLAEFKGGQKELFRFLGNNVKYPADARENGIEGTVYIGFVIEKDGSITNISLKRGVDPTCNDESMRVIYLMNGKWNAGSDKGQKVRIAYTLPIRFKLE
jgi:TonB family protein